MIIDFHGHVGRWDALDMIDDPAEMLRAMDAVGIDKSCVFNIFHPDGKPGNDQTAAFVARHPDRFIGFAYVCPTCPDTVRPELERAIDELGFRAIKIYPPYTPFPLDDSAWDPIYEFAAERGLAIIAHTGGEPTASPAQFGRAAAPLSHRPLRRRPLRQHRAVSQPSHCRGPAFAQLLPRNLLDLPHSRRHRRAGGQGRGRPRALRLGYALDGPPPPARQDHHRGY